MLEGANRRTGGPTIAYLTQASRTTGVNRVSEILSQLSGFHSIGFHEGKMTGDFDEVM